MKRALIMSFDGGGTKGVFPALLLDLLDQKFLKMNTNLVNILKERYDLIVFTGTSVGSIIASILYKKTLKGEALLLTSTVHELLDKVFDKKKLGFGIFGKYKSDYLIEMVEKHCLTDERNPNIELVVPAYCVERKDFVIKSMFSEQRDGLYNSIPWRDQIIGSCSAPTFFDPRIAFDKTGRKVKLIDGGVIVNNPVMMAFTEMTKQYSANEFELIDVYSFGIKEDALVKYENIFDLLRMLIATSTDTSVEDCYMFTLTKSLPQLRVRPHKVQQLGVNRPLDCVDKEFMNTMKNMAIYEFEKLEDEFMLRSN